MSQSLAPKASHPRQWAVAPLRALPVWQSMDSAPTDRQILVRRHNDCFYEYYVVWFNDEDEQYPWRSEYTAYPTDRLDEWFDIPGGECASAEPTP